MGAGLENPLNASPGPITPATSNTTTAPITPTEGAARSLANTYTIAAKTNNVSQACQLIPASRRRPTPR